VYCRADLSRTTVPVVALLLATVSTGVFAREFCALHPQSGSDLQGGSLPITPKALHGGPASGVFHIHPFNAEQAGTGLDRTNVALIGPVTPLLVCRHRRTERI
jgi:hypothetical protein